MRTKLTLIFAFLALSFGLFATTADAAIKHRHHHRHHASLKHHHHRSSFPAVSQATRANVKAMIAAQAPHYGVPAWFAQRIAKVESGFNPRVTGSNGEIGVFQMKCQTARGLGFSGSCSALYDPATNIHWGLRHLSLAVRASHGNLRLAASMHNGGLGCRHIVKRYVAMIF